MCLYNEHLACQDRNDVARQTSMYRFCNESWCGQVVKARCFESWGLPA